MQVVALETGFYLGERKRTGAIFNLDESKLKKKNGEAVLPKWVKAVPDVRAAKAEAAAAVKAEQEKQRAGAIAASGGKAAKEKSDALAKELAG